MAVSKTYPLDSVSTTDGIEAVKILDDASIYRTATGKSACGIIVAVDTDGVWVRTSL